MTIIQLIKELIKDGYDISYYKRKDGGYRITRINGERFSGSRGNVAAREIAGTELSENQIRALRKIQTPKGRWGNPKETPVTMSVRKQIRMLQRLYREAGKKEGKPTIKNYRYIKKHYGEEEAQRLLKQSLRRIMGLAYPENVEALLLRIRMDLDKKPDLEMSKVYGEIEGLKYNFKERWIYQIYEVLYDWERGIIEGDKAATKIRYIMI